MCINWLTLENLKKKKKNKHFINICRLLSLYCLMFCAVVVVVTIIIIVCYFLYHHWNGSFACLPYACSTNLNVILNLLLNTHAHAKTQTNLSCIECLLQALKCNYCGLSSTDNETFPQINCVNARLFLKRKWIFN